MSYDIYYMSDIIDLPSYFFLLSLGSLTVLILLLPVLSRPNLSLPPSTYKEAYQSFHLKLVCFSFLCGFLFYFYVFILK